MLVFADILKQQQQQQQKKKPPYSFLGFSLKKEFEGIWIILFQLVITYQMRVLGEKGNFYHCILPPLILSTPVAGMKNKKSRSEQQ